MVIDVLRLVGSGRGKDLSRFPLDSARFEAQLDAAPRPAIFVLRTRDLRSLLDGESVRRAVLSLRSQHPGKGLAHYFSGHRPVALEGKYTEPERLRSAVRKFLASAREAGEQAVHLLGVESGVFDALARETGAEKISPEDEFRGSSAEAGEVRRRIRRAATDPRFSNTPVLILAPTGSGKEIVARAIHDLGRGAQGGSWVPLNCAEFPGDMLEAELFGVEPGTATGVVGRIGLWEQASVGRGTLFLNEVGDLREDHQAKLLRALEEGEIRRVGGREQIRVSARIIADTNRDLFSMVEKGTFRRDLYYRLARLIIRVPDLAERGTDLDELAQYVWREQVTGSEKAVLSPEIIEALRASSLGGGVRELKAVLESLYSEYGEVAPSLRQLLGAWRVRGDGPYLRSAAGGATPPGVAAAKPGSLESLREQVDLFESQRARYERLKDVLRSTLERIAERAAPLAIVHARTKSVASFAERVQRDQARFEELRDLCGARIVVHTEDQIREVCALLERYFEVDAEESTTEETHSGVSRPGFAARRLVVRLDRPRAQALSAALAVAVPDQALGLWAEIEVRTVLEHAWAHLSREMGHAERLPLPARWSEELGEVARVLEAVDTAFARIHTGFAAYRTSYPAHLSPDRKRREVAILANVLACDPDPRVAVRLAKLAITDGDWERAIAVLEPYAAAGYQPALRDLGVAICQKHRHRTESAEHARGQSLLEQACAEPHRDPDAWASLGGTWKRRGRYDKAHECYGRALALDPADPYALGGVLEAELVLHPEIDTVAALTPSIQRAVERCRQHVEAGVNLPWALYDLGRFLLLLGERGEGLIACARAVQLSTAGFMIQTSFESLERFAERREKWAGVDEARAILALGWAVKFPSEAAQRQLEKLMPARRKLRAPVVFVVGDSDGSGREVSPGRAAVDQALRGHRGTVITSDWLQAWADVIGSGIRPSDVAVLAVGSSEDAEIESGIAAALGAHLIEAASMDAKGIRALLETAR